MQVWIFYRNFKQFVTGLSHVGLGNNALLTAKALKGAGVDCRIEGVWTAAHIRRTLTKYRDTATHAVVEAAFYGYEEAAALAADFPDVEFVYRNHSQVGFLQVEPTAVRWFREYARLQEASLNVRLSANNRRFVDWWAGAYNQRCLYLPNLYPTVDRVVVKKRRAQFRDTLRIGSFGSLRLLKNHATACAGAMLAARGLGCDLEFYMNSNRDENGGRAVVEAVRQMTAGLPWVKFVAVPWQHWVDFRHTVAAMDLCMQPSFTETFNIVTADAAAEGVPSVVSDAIEWAPRHWMAQPDEAEDVARVGRTLLLDPDAGAAGWTALVEYQKGALKTWLVWLGLETCPC